MIVTVLQAVFFVVLLGNMIAFAGVDPVSRVITAAAAVFFAVQFRRLPAIPRLLRWVVAGTAILITIQVLPLPEGIRAVIQPGFRAFFPTGWASLSLAPWATLQVAGALVVTGLIALQAARMARTRSGLPLLLTAIAATGVVGAILGLVTEAGDSTKVLFVRDNVFGGSVFGPFVNRNHFAQAMELTIPAVIVIFALAARRLRSKGLDRQKAVVTTLAAGVALIVCAAALIRSSSRGGVLFMAIAVAAALPWWRRFSSRRRRVWPVVAAGLVVAVIVGVLSWTELPLIRERFSELVAVEGLEGNTRIDLWRGTLASWRRSPVVGSGLGTYRYVIAIDKPATGAAVLQQAHNDWLETLSTGGVVGFGLLGVGVFAVGRLLAPGRTRRLRAEFRYAMSAAVIAFSATMLHETIGFGLQTPVNRYLLAAWIGLVVGVAERTTRNGENPGRIHDERA